MTPNWPQMVYGEAGAIASQISLQQDRCVAAVARPVLEVASHLSQVAPGILPSETKTIHAARALRRCP
jgi:hypothetical protein